MPDRTTSRRKEMGGIHGLGTNEVLEPGCKNGLSGVAGTSDAEKIPRNESQNKDEIKVNGEDLH